MTNLTKRFEEALLSIDRITARELLPGLIRLEDTFQSIGKVVIISLDE